MLKQTPLYAQHNILGAKMIEFAGYSMPIWYKRAKDEHLAVRQHLGMFDISHMGFIWVSGNDAAQFLQKMCTNDIRKITQTNRIIYTMILNHDGGILDDGMVGFDAKKNQYFMIVNASNKQKLLHWFDQHINGDVQIVPQFDTHGLMAIQGPDFQQVLASIVPIDWALLGRFQSQRIQMNGMEYFVMRTGYTGEDGIEVLCQNQGIDMLWRRCLAHHIQPCGLAARDSLRIEYGLPLYGHELSENITPRQTRYSWVLAWGTNFNGESALKQHENNRVTVGLKFADRCLPRQGCLIQEGGVITSGTFSPVLNCPIAMAIVPAAQSEAVVHVNIRGTLVNADIVKLPFI